MQIIQNTVVVSARNWRHECYVHTYKARLQCYESKKCICQTGASLTQSIRYEAKRTPEKHSSNNNRRNTIWTYDKCGVKFIQALHDTNPRKILCISILLYRQLLLHDSHACSIHTRMQAHNLKIHQLFQQKFIHNRRWTYVK